MGKEFVLIVGIIGSSLFFSGLDNHDPRANFSRRYADRTTYTVKTDEPLVGINCEGVILDPRMAIDPKPLFRLRKNDQSTNKRLEWNNCGSFRLPADFGDATIRILNYEVTPDNSAIMTYCVDPIP